MTAAQTSMPVSIRLWTALLQRWRGAAATVVRRLRHAAQRAAGQRAAERQARRQHALSAHLDAHALRDVGLGDWAASARDSDDSHYRRALELRGF